MEGSLGLSIVGLSRRAISMFMRKEVVGLVLLLRIQSHLRRASKLKKLGQRWGKKMRERIGMLRIGEF